MFSKRTWMRSISWMVSLQRSAVHFSIRTVSEFHLVKFAIFVLQSSNWHLRIHFRFVSFPSLPFWPFLLAFFRLWTVSEDTSIALFLSLDSSDTLHALRHPSRSKSATFRRSSGSFESRIPRILRSRTSESRRVLKIASRRQNLQVDYEFVERFLIFL